MSWFWEKSEVPQIGRDSDLVLFPDTNFLYHCHPPENLDWTDLDEFNNIFLVITHPVQREVDGHKNRGSGRRAKKARAAASRFLAILRDPAQEFVARKNSPCVHMVIRKDLLPAKKLDKRLDMSEPDDQLVAIAHAYARRYPKQDVRILTLDSGPVATAHMLGVEELVAPDPWRLDPESDPQEKELRRVTAELSRLRKAEPSFEFSFTDSSSEGFVDSIDIDFCMYERLSEEEISDLIEIAVKANPKATEFGCKSKESRKTIFGFGTVWEPASNEQIEKYAFEYDEWLDKCRSVFGELHEQLLNEQTTPSLCAIVMNKGTRPAKDALIEISVSEGMQLRVPVRDDQKEDGLGVRLPKPPTPPDGKWVTAVIGIDDVARKLKVADVGLPDEFFGQDRMRSNLYSPPLPSLTAPTARDPNSFYYKPNRPTLPTQTVTLECAQWRHAAEPEEFCVEFVIGSNFDKYQGAITVTVHAENLSDLAKRTVPVRIKRTSVSCYAKAKELIANVAEGSD